LDRIKDVLEAVASEILRGKRNREKALAHFPQMEVNGGQNSVIFFGKV
jgi:hypothetical protein